METMKPLKLLLYGRLFDPQGALTPLWSAKKMDTHTHKILPRVLKEAPPEPQAQGDSHKLRRDPKEPPTRGIGLLGDNGGWVSSPPPGSLWEFYG